MMEQESESNVSLHQDVEDISQQITSKCILQENTDEQPTGNHPEIQRQSFTKRGGTDNMTGPLYEIKMVALMYLRGLNHTNWFHLAANMDEAGAFDDLVFQFQSIDPGDPATKNCFIQLKHKNTNTMKITLKDFRLPKSRFYLKKYYDSYIKIEEIFSSGSINPVFSGNFEETIFVLFTNAEIDKNIIKCDNTSIVSQILNTCNKKCTPVSSFDIDNETVCSLLKGDAKANTFLATLKLFDNQANEKQLNDLIKQEIVSYFHVLVPEIDIIVNDFILKIQKWYQNDDFFLTKSWSEWSDIETSLKSRLTKLSHWRGLGYTFNEVECDNLAQHIRSNFTTLFLTMVGNDTDLRSLKLHATLEKTHSQRYLLVNVSELVEHLNEILAVWDSELCDVMAIDTEDSMDKILPLISRLQVILEKRNKIVVLILDANNNTLCHILKCMLVGCCEEYKDIWNLYQFDQVSQEYILDRKVNFQGYEVSFSSLVNTCNELKPYINNEVLTKLLNMDEFILGTKLEEKSKLYIPRTVEFEVEVKERVLQDEELVDIFVVSGIIYKELKNIVPPHETIDMWDTNYMGHTTRYITLESEYDSEESSDTDDYEESDMEVNSEILAEDETASVTSATDLAHDGFEDDSEELSLDSDNLREKFMQVCKANKNQTVHWLQYKNNQFFWKESQGSKENLHNYIVKEADMNVPTYKYMDEYEMSTLEAEHLITSWSKLTFIGGEPGMGKSLLFTHIAHKMKQNEHCAWVVRINLSNLTDILSNINSDNLSLDKAIDILINVIIGDESSCPEFAKIFFRKCLIDIGNVAILLDAFDEISPTYTIKVVSFIEVLLKTKLTKLWVSFRPVMQSKLEKCFTTPSFTLQPFTYQDQYEFLISVWQEKLGGCSPDIKWLEIFVENLLNLIYDLDYDNPITGIPLHIMMLAEAYEQQMENFNKSHNMNLIPKYLKLHQLYKGFIDKRRDIYCIKKNDMNLTKPGMIHDANELHKLFMKQHTKCALVVVLSPEELAVLHDTQIQEEVELFLTTIENCKEMTGIIDSVNDQKPHFIHFTFSEYLVAQWLAQHLDKNKPFFESYFFQDKFDLVREMFNYILADQHELHEAVLENDLKRIKLLGQIEEIDSGGRTPLHVAALYGNKNIINLLLEKGADIDRKDTKLLWKAINYAEKVKNWPVIDTLLEKGSKCYELCFMESRSSLHMFFCNDVKSAMKRGCTSLIKNALCMYLNSFNTSLQDIVNDFNLLFYVAYYGQLDFLKYLIQEDIDIDVSILGTTLLHLSATRGHAHIVKFLVDKGFEIDKRDDFSCTPLHFASRQGHMEVVCYLVENGANICEYNNQHFTPIHQAVLKGDEEIVTYLLEKVNNLDGIHVPKNLLCFAAQSGVLEIVKYLVKNGFDIDFNDNLIKTPIYNAIMYNHLHIVRYLLDKHVNVTTDPILHLAIAQRKYDMVHLMIEKGVDVNGRENVFNETILHKLSKEGNEEQAQYIIEHGANVNAVNIHGETPLHISLSNEHIGLSKMLIDKGANINQPSRYDATPLHNAAILGCEEIVHYLVESGADINSMGTHTPLHGAACSGNVLVVQYLLERGADINAGNNGGGTPLHSAAITDDIQTVQYLLEKGANINATDLNGNTPLHMSASYGKIKILQHLIETGADINVMDNVGQTALHSATTSNYFHIDDDNKEKGLYIQYKIVQYLIEKGANINASDINGQTSLHNAVSIGQVQTVLYLIEKGASLSATDNNGHTPLHTATYTGQNQIVQHLIEKGANVNATDNNGCTPLHTATSIGNEQIVQHLIKKGTNLIATVNSGQFSLYNAVSISQVQTVQYLIEKDANLNATDNNGCTPLHTAISTGNEQIVQHLIEKGANVNATDNNGLSPLHIATSTGNEQIVQHLIEKGANVNATDNNGLAPLHTATTTGLIKIVQHLIDKGANVNATDNNGCTLLHTAISIGNEQIVQHLIEKGANVNATDNNGLSPLHIATSTGNEQIVQHLIEKCANVNATDNNGFAPLHTATSTGNEQIVQYLIEKGANVNATDNNGLTSLHAATSTDQD